jgi:hypothetical protein
MLAITASWGVGCLTGQKKGAGSFDRTVAAAAEQ